LESLDNAQRCSGELSQHDVLHLNALAKRMQFLPHGTNNLSRESARFFHWRRKVTLAALSWLHHTIFQLGHCVFEDSTDLELCRVIAGVFYDESQSIRQCVLCERAPVAFIVRVDKALDRAADAVGSSLLDLSNQLRMITRSLLEIRIKQLNRRKQTVLAPVHNFYQK
jgi:hypothetical protein